MAKPIVHGPGFSTYVRTVRLTLEEKGVEYGLNEFNFFDGMPAEQLDRHPFGKVPAFEHDGFVLYETFPICRYIDEVFDGQSLQPADVQLRARMTQIAAVLSTYAYTPMITNLVIQRLVVPKMGGEADETLIRNSLPDIRKVLAALEDLMGDQGFLVGNDLTLADCHLIPMFTYFMATPESGPIVEDRAKLRAWWEGIQHRESVVHTVPQLD
jgi:glutathione S-transferase